MENLNEEYIKQRDEEIDEILKSEDISEYKKYTKNARLNLVLGCIEIMIFLPIFMYCILGVIKIPMQFSIVLYVIMAGVLSVTWILYLLNKFKADQEKCKFGIDMLNRFFKDKFTVEEIEDELEEQETGEKMVEALRKCNYRSFFEYSDYECNKILNLEKHGKKMQFGKFIFSEYDRKQYIYRSIYILTMDVASSKKIDIEEIRSFSSKNEFDKYFTDYTNKSFDKKYENFEQYQLSESEKEIFMNFLNKYKLNCKFIMTNGVLRFICKRINANNLEEEIKNNYDVANCMSEFVDKFRNI